MRIGIITPTFQPHFQYVDRMLESMCKYVVDRKNVPIYFTISAKERFEFNKIANKYKSQLDVRIFIFEEILEAFGVNTSPEALLKKYGKFSFQTLKKFYSMLYADADYFLVLDSESMWIRETNMHELFEKYFADPFIAGAVRNKYYESDFNKNVNDNISHLLDFDSNLWFLEHFAWYYDKKILKDMFGEIGSPIYAIESVHKKIKKIGVEKGIGVFEIALYQNYLYKNYIKYNIRVINVTNSLKKYLGDDGIERYYENYYKKYDGNCGLVERALCLLEKDNWNLIADMFLENGLDIIRCDYSKKIILQKNFINKVNPYILAASQEHFFGLNDSFIYKSKEILKYIKRHLKNRITIIEWKIPIIRGIVEKKTMYWRIAMIHNDLYNVNIDIKKIYKKMNELETLLSKEDRDAEECKDLKYE